MNLAELSRHLSGKPVPSTEKHVLSEGENRFVSILFADVQGFTSLSEQLEPELVHALLDQLMSGFSERVRKYNGYVDKYEGDRIMAHFGSVEFLEQNARRAVLAGLEFIEVVKRFNQLLPHVEELSGIHAELAIRVGIDNGIVTTGKVGLKRDGDFTTYGDNVNVASRMESMGAVNRVMVPEWVKKDLDKYFFFDFNANLVVKGKSEPIPTYFVKGVNRLRKNRAVSHSRFIGRIREMNVLISSVRRNRPDGTPATDPRVEIVGIKAPAGMGKTRLSREFLRTLPPDSAFRAEVSPFGQPPFGLFAALFRDVLGIESNAEIPVDRIKQQIYDLISDLPDTLALDGLRSIPDITGLLGYTEETIRYEPPRTAILTLVMALAVRAGKTGQPLTLFLDDLHWADDGSLAMLEYLVRNLRARAPEIPTARTVLVIAYRDGFIIPGTIRQQSRFTEIALRELHFSEVQRFMRNLLPNRVLPTSLQKTLYEKSAGNPFFLEEWVASIRDTIEQNEAIDLERLAIPNNVFSLVLSRLNRFTKAVVEVLRHASVIGTEFPRSMLTDLEHELGLGDDFHDALHQFTEAGVLSMTPGDDPVYCFRHQIGRDAIYSTLLKSNARILHEIVGTLIERRPATPEHVFMLAHHFALATNHAKAREYLLAGAELATRHGMSRKALTFREQLLPLCSPREAVTNLTAIASLHLNMGDIVRARKTLTRVHLADSESPTDKDTYILVRARLLQLAGDISKALAFLERNPVTSQQSRTDARIAMLDLHRLERLDIVGEAKALLEEITEPATQAQIWNMLGLHYQFRADYTEALTCYRKALETVGDNRILARWIHQNTGAALCRTGATSEAIQAYHKALSLARLTDDTGGIGKVLSDLATIYMNGGEFGKAGSMFMESMEIARLTGNRNLLGIALYNLATNHYHMKDFHQARAYLKEGIAVCEEIGDRSGLCFTADLLGDILYTDKLYAQARRVYLKNIRVQEELGDHEGIAHSVGNLANIALMEGDLDSAETLYDRQQRELHTIGDVSGEARAIFNRSQLDVKQNCLPSAIARIESALAMLHHSDIYLYDEVMQNRLDTLRKRNDESSEK
jgi:adenylate cyclase